MTYTIRGKVKDFFTKRELYRYCAAISFRSRGRKINQPNIAYIQSKYPEVTVQDILDENYPDLDQRRAHKDLLVLEHRLPDSIRDFLFNGHWQEHYLRVVER